MPAFISYNSNDRAFAERLATRLVADGHSIWIDKWELSVGDSLIERIQKALDTAAAVISVLSKHSVVSEWCNKEINTTLVRELERKGSILLPCIIDDCQIPLFLREKLYADFRADERAAYQQLSDSLRRFSNLDQARINGDKYHTDWSYSSGEDHLGRRGGEWVYIDHSDEAAFSILTVLRVCSNELADRRWRQREKEGAEHIFLATLLALILDGLQGGKVLLYETKPRRHSFKVRDSKGLEFDVHIETRRLGSDNGKSSLVDLRENIKRTIEHVAQAYRAKMKSAS